MFLKPRGHYSSLRDKIQVFGVDMVKFKCARGGATGDLILVQERDKLLNVK